MGRQFPRPTARRGPSARFIALVPALLAIVLYARAAANGFALDDKVDLLSNRLVTGPLDLAAIFGSEYFGGWGGIASGHYRPVLNLAYKLIAALFGLAPLPYHVVNVLLFALLAAQTTLLVRKLSADATLAIASGLLVAVHPMSVESVAAIAGLKELLSALCGISALTLLSREREGGGSPAGTPGWLTASGAFLLSLAGMLTKETALAFVPIALGVEFLHPRAPRPRRLRDVVARAMAVWPLAAAAAASLALRALVTGGLFRPTVVYGVDNPLADSGGATRLLGALSLPARYLALYAWPACLSSDYSDGAFDLPVLAADPWVLASAGACAGMAGLFLLALRRGWATVALGLVGFAAAYSMVSNVIVTIGTLMAERLFFLPAWGLSLALAGVVVPAARTLQLRLAPVRPPERAAGAAMLAIGLLALPLAVRTWVRIPDWRDDRALVTADLRCRPRSVKLLTAAGSLEERGGRLGHARDFYERAVSSRPASSYARGRLGLFLLNTGDLARAEPLLRAACAARDPIPEFRLGLALLHVRSDRPEEAIVEARRLMERGGSHEDLDAARVVLGEALLMKGSYGQAVEVWRDLAASGPPSPIELYNLGLSLEGAGDLPGAIEAYRAASRLAPGELEVLRHLGVVEALSGRSGEALGTAADLDRLPPDGPAGQPGEGAPVRALAWVRSGRVEEAAELARSATVRAGADDPIALHVLGAAHRSWGHQDEARAYFQAVLMANRSFPALRAAASRELGSR